MYRFVLLTLLAVRQKCMLTVLFYQYSSIIYFMENPRIKNDRIKVKTGILIIYFLRTNSKDILPIEFHLKNRDFATLHFVENISPVLCGYPGT